MARASVLMLLAVAACTSPDFSFEDATGGGGSGDPNGAGGSGMGGQGGSPASGPGGQGGQGGQSDDGSEAMLDSLQMFRIESPCGALQAAENSCGCAPAMADRAVAGTTGVPYVVRLRVRGVAELKTYVGGTQVGQLYTGGMAADDLWNIIRMDVSDPPQTFFLNAGMSEKPFCVPLDYSFDVTVEGGGSIALSIDPVNMLQIRNVDAGAVPIIVDEIAPFPDAFDGQFLQLDAVDAQIQ